MSSAAPLCATCVAVVALPPVLRLRDLPPVIVAIGEALADGPGRIELDARQVRVLSEGARRLLLAATERLAALGVELVVVACEPFE